MRKIRPLIALALAFSLSGCGVMFGGTTKNISITSAPSAATIHYAAWDGHVYDPNYPES